MKIPETLKAILTEKDQKEIKAEFDKQVTIMVEAALHQYDDEAEAKINKLIEQIDECHKVKLIKLFEDRKAKEKKLIENIKNQYESVVNADADKFKVNLAKNIERFIENKISKIVNYKTIQEAATNNTARIVLGSLRTQLSVDSALMKESISTPMIQAREKMKGAAAYIKKLKLENQRLNESLSTTESNLLIESKINGLPETTANYMRRMLENKEVSYIKENYSYILDLYKENQNKKRLALKEQALINHNTNTNRIKEPKRSTDLIKESKRVNKSEDFDLLNEILADMADD